MLLVERGQLDLADRVSTWLPAFAAHGKQDITVAQLLLHRGGLPPDNPESDYIGTRQQMLDRVYALPTVHEPGARFVYSDVGYIVLGELVRVIDGRPLDQFAREEIFEPLGMKDTMFLPPESLKPRCAPTERRGDHWMLGEVHDPRAYALGGVAGHAGLFSTADDLSRFCRMVLGGGTLGGKRVLSDMTVREMIRPRCLAGGIDCRSYGFDVDTSYSSARGNLFDPDFTFGHTGFTGTMFWLDPVHRCYAILLTNRVHPDGKGLVGELRTRVMNVVASAIIEAADERYAPAAVLLPNRQPATATRPAQLPDVLCGIDVLERDGFRLLAGMRLALLTNHTGRDRQGRRTIDLLAGADGVKLMRLLSPEHGPQGTADGHVADTVDEKTGIKIYSLYGPAQRPTPELLEAIDAVVFDVQDIGTRFYTYAGTLGLVMEAAAKRDIEVVVLDRPNPIGGVCVDGPIWDRPERSLVGYGPLPVVHGMTVGELARLFNDQYGIRCRLMVVPIEGWRRAMTFDRTGLAWINPSPNMRNLTQAMLYPGIGLLETTNLSVGRGTDQPFETLGAPWIDGRQLAAALNAADLPGLRFVPIEFTPKSSTFASTACQGVHILVTDSQALQPVRAGLTIAWHLRKLFGSKFEIDRMAALLGNAEALEALKSTDDPRKTPALWRQPLAEFRAVRARYLMYHE
jgi:uncharacterized protein YbbC (DUF1343 family)/CubicO group peptidase (beta-lactamase class C family)